MRRPVFWAALALAAGAAIAIGVRYFPQAFSLVALDITMDRAHALEQARTIAVRDTPRAARLHPGRLVRRRRRGADVRRARRRRQGRVHAPAARPRLRRLHVAGAPLQGRRDQRNDDRVRPGRTARTASKKSSRKTPPAPRSPKRRRAGIAEDGAAARWEVPLRQLSRSSSTARSAVRRGASITPSPTSAATSPSTKGGSACGSSSPATS